ncbi:anthranilate O-methyltransferase 3-like isoform X1 [Zingiber officinale]|uniref:anthranilate O-methyltransferase 3-like isoform X1 n=2 Tax=Zingiber officinale TaxID=94328 RepID=UPI001C4C2445|nr:anthranilate O-methyltransferase 3-like isoform X1 [Zingiber officinale]
MGFKVEQVLHMVRGAGETSYATNSRLQEKAIYRTKPILANAIEEVYKELVPEHMVIVDLGCSSGPNTFIVVSQVLNIIVELRRMMEMKKPLEVQFLLNDLPGNDFNYVFQSLHKFKKKVEEETKGELLVPYYVVGVPGSFYGRLFPRASVHFFHSSYSLMWLSQVPKELEHEQGVPLNKGNIYWTETTPQVEKAYREQYKKDFLTFLRSRYTELNMGGGMVLTFLGRRKRTPGHGDLCHLYGLLAEALNSMVLEGILSEEKVDTFNLPLYGPFLEDVKSVIHHEGLFNLDRVEIFESNWDPFDDSEDHSFNFALRNYTKSAKNVADCIRAVLEPLIVHQFGDAILDDLFTRYTHNVSKHLIKEKANHTILVFALKKCI